ncbi:unnamed protein product [Arabidopsis thaliana]|uniref:(thale cress) hypothetical protein n=1 Tax=Arabidopsis thaliana TaxID=3702 RepID=A0A7G2F017_ARATH|nr:unnamed protein product [Arabidopsis thaliana]
MILIMELKHLLPIFWFLFIGFVVVFAPECGKTGVFVPSGRYDKNRGLVLSSLASNVSAQGGYFNTSLGQGPDQVYALGMCIQGAEPEVCYNCIDFASTLLLSSCPNQTEGLAWSEKRVVCMVRYSNSLFFGSLTIEPHFPTPSQDDIRSDLAEFDQAWQLLTIGMIANTTSPSSKSKYYAADEATLPASRIIYALMQCTPDLSLEDCRTCLKQSVSDFQSCCNGKQGGTVYRASCLFRWDLFPFAEAFSRITLAPPAVTNTTTKKDTITISMAIFKGIVSSIVIIIILLLLAFGFVFYRRRKSYQESSSDITITRSLQFDFKAIEAATDKFSESNIIGRGGFGEVFKAVLNGTEVAIKRLSKSSKQGAGEFKNEVAVVAKLHHRNLVRLLGFCLEGEEKILVYEFVPNKSLDYFLFDTTAENLVTCAWKLWRKGSQLELVDPTISENCETEEVIRCIHIALLCVQQSPTDRPSLSTINMMLTSNSYVLPDPQQPGFFFPNKSNKERDGLESSQYTNRCGKTGFSLLDDTFDKNRRLLLSSLASNASDQGGFYSASVGQGSEQIYAEGLCIPGAEPKDCSNCFNYSSNSVIERCRNQTEGLIWSDDVILCMIRFSNRLFSGSLEMEPSYNLLVNGDIQVNLTEFDRSWEDLTSHMIAEATSSSSQRKYYAAEAVSLTSFQNIYLLMQCTPFISLRDCNTCLSQSVRDYKSCCYGKKGGNVNRPSCFFRTNTNKRGIIVGITVVLTLVISVLLVLGYSLCRRRKASQEFATERSSMTTYGTAPPENATDDITTSGSLQFEFKSIETATSNFEKSNKLGHGGFGEVYKGTFPNGTEVAVKRLSKTSGQGEQEFKNEVLLVAKLQHRNLVRLLGFSVEGEEKILVYKFVHNKSLDYFLFDSSIGNLVTYVWRLWNNGSSLELIDPAMGENYDKDEVIRCIHIGLLCVQENPADRPTMSIVFQMLTNTTITLPIPQMPGFVFRVRPEPNPSAERLQPGPSTAMSFACSIDDASITSVNPR